MSRDRSTWHKVKPNDPNKKESFVDGQCSICGNVKLYYNKTQKAFKCSVAQIRKDRKSEGKAWADQHRISGIDRTKKEKQFGLCSICGPMMMWYSSGSWNCSEKQNRYYEKYALHKQYKWNSRIKKMFKLTPEELIKLFNEQDGKCSICYSEISLDLGSKNKAHIDHDHSCCTGTFVKDKKTYNQEVCGKCNRGLLCKKCNFGLGHFKDDINILENAIKYLNKYSS